MGNDSDVVFGGSELSAYLFELDNCIELLQKTKQHLYAFKQNILTATSEMEDNDVEICENSKQTTRDINKALTACKNIEGIVEVVFEQITAMREFALISVSKDDYMTE